MCYVAAAAYAIGALFTIGAAYSSVETSKATAQYTADVSKENAAREDYRASQAATIGAIQEEQQRAKVRKLAGAQRADFAAKGIDLGSGVVQDMLDETYTLGETDALTIRYNAMNEAWGYRSRAVDARNEGRFAKYRGKREAQSTYLSTAASLAGSTYSTFG